MAAAARLAKRLGRNAIVSFLARPRHEDVDAPFAPAFQTFRGRVETADRSGLWLEFDSAPGLQQLWPDDRWEYTEITIIPPNKTRPIAEEDPTRNRRPRPVAPEDDEPPRRARRQEAPDDQERNPGAIASAIALAVKTAMQEMAAERGPAVIQRPGAHTTDADDIRDIALGEAGLWTVLVPGLKIPTTLPDDICWAYLDAPAFAAKAVALGFRGGQEWAERALTFRVSKSVAFRTLALANEADYAVQNLAELVCGGARRTTKTHWLAVFSVVARLLQLWIMGSSLGGAAAAARFASEYEKCVANKDSKLDWQSLVQDALAAPTPTSQPQETTKAAQPKAEDTIPKAEVMKRIDDAVAAIVKSNRAPRR